MYVFLADVERTNVHLGQVNDGPNTLSFDDTETVHLKGCDGICQNTSHGMDLQFGFWAVRFMELFNYCVGSRLLVDFAFQNARGDPLKFVEEMHARGLPRGHAHFLFDMLESIAVDPDTLERVN